jgi:PhzF family phenazine biosynthesis protein
VSHKIYQVDTFTNVAFGGNPAAVILLDGPADPRWLQSIAAEINLSDTAFVFEREEGGYGLRWFTPTVEVDLCGHATIAAAHILFEEGIVPEDEYIRFYTKSGLLITRKQGDWIEMNFPVDIIREVEVPPTLATALDFVPKFMAKGKFDYLVECPSEAFVRNLKPDFELLATLPVRGVIVTALSTMEGIDFVSRFFAPGAGINEDSVTGSAHCTLGAFYREILGITEMTAFQASKRGGVVKIAMHEERILLSGQAVMISKGVISAAALTTPDTIETPVSE